MSWARLRYTEKFLAQALFYINSASGYVFPFMFQVLCGGIYGGRKLIQQHQKGGGGVEGTAYSNLTWFFFKGGTRLNSRFLLGAI